MKIKDVHIKNFRCLHDLSIPFENLTALVGRNGCGKSSVLKAIEIYYDVNYNADLEDFCNRVTDDPIEINITFQDFTEQELENFNYYIDNDLLTVTKRFSWVEGRTISGYYASTRQIQEFADIRNIDGLRNQQTRIRELISSGRYDELEGTFRSAQEGLNILRQYEEDHQELTELIESNFQFMGARNVGGGSLDNYTKFVMLPAVKEATEEIEGRSPIGQLIDAIVLTEVRSRQDLIEFQQRINEEIQETYSPENLGGLDQISEEISKLLDVYAPNSGLKIRWGDPLTVDIKTPPVIYKLVEDEFEGEISNKGHGLQRALVLTLFDYMARQVQNQEEGRVQVDIILALEEPEIYLHPARCRYLANLLLDLSNRGRAESGQNRIQVIYSTHSPHFVEFDRFDDIRILRKTANVEIGVPTTNETHFTIEEAANKYCQVTGRRRDDLTREHFRVITIPIMKPLVNEGFFSDLIVLVEGQSDVGYLWKLQEIMGKEWEKYAIALIPVGGKQQLIKAGVIFRGIRIPTYTIFDCDTGDTSSMNKVLRLLNQPSGYPTEFVHDDWACHELNLETTVREAVGDDNYKRVWNEVKTDFDITSERLYKNPEATSKFVEIAYEVGLTIRPLERMVDAISAYYDSVT